MTIPGESYEIAAEDLQKQDLLRRGDAACACYAVLGLAVTVISVVAAFFPRLVPPGLGIFFDVLPLLLVSAFVGTVVLTVKAQRHRPLVILFYVHLLFLMAMFLALVEKLPDFTEDVLFWSYGAVFTFVPVWWFTAGRQRWG